MTKETWVEKEGARMESRKERRSRGKGRAGGTGRPFSTSILHPPCIRHGGQTRIW